MSSGTSGLRGRGDPGEDEYTDAVRVCQGRAWVRGRMGAGAPAVERSRGCGWESALSLANPW